MQKCFCLIALAGAFGGAEKGYAHHVFAATYPAGGFKWGGAFE